MEVSPNVLRKEAVEVLREINHELDKPPGNRPVGDHLATLLLAKAQCLNTLVLLRGK
jgi:hypothetical protein